MKDWVFNEAQLESALKQWLADLRAQRSFIRRSVSMRDQDSVRAFFASNAAQKLMVQQMPHQVTPC